MDRILVIENDAASRRTFLDLLKEAGYEVDCASCGNEGLRMLAERKHALVITDLIMPDISGMEILSQVRTLDPSIDVIMVTGNANLESAIFALKHGARDYLVKPVNRDEFRHSVAQCMEQRRLLDENQELKNMLSLFQASQAISCCIEQEKICHLLVEALAKEIGVRRVMGLFLFENRPEVRETREISVETAGWYQQHLLAEIGKQADRNQVMMVVSLPAPPAGHGDAAGIRQACLIQVRHKADLLGVVALFNDEDQPLPAIISRKKNVLFLLEQATLAFDNAASYLLVKDMVFIDDLTGLFNYRYLDIALTRELKRVERYSSHLSILFLDLDTFKQVNDRHGHMVGSKVLQEVGALLKRSVREIDVVIRYGGDEYTIILIETNCAAAACVAERIRAMIQKHTFLAAEGYDIRVTCSIGYACCPDDTGSKEELLSMADKAMYAGKNSGRNCVKHFLPEY